MIIETDAIVLSSIKYSETSIIAHLYTEKYGNGSYIMNNVRTNHSKMAFFQPLSHIHITAYRKKESNQIHRISQITFASVPQSITSNIYKSTIALFIGELCNRLFHEEEYAPEIYSFLKTFVSYLDAAESDYVNLHILFLLHITKILGVFPANNYDKEHPLFSVSQAKFITPNTPEATLSINFSELFARILTTKGISDSIQLTHEERRDALSCLMAYYDEHLCNTQTIKSLEVLRLVFE